MQDRNLSRIDGLMLGDGNGECLYMFCITISLVSLTGTFVKKTSVFSGNFYLVCSSQKSL